MQRRFWTTVIASALGVGVMFTLFVATTGLSQAQEPPPQNPEQPQSPFGTAFTYQGHLKKNGAPITDNCSLAFRLYDQASSGSQIGSPITTTAPITNGLFSVPLDFGASAFAGEARWLGIQVKCPTDGAYIDLGRQALTAAPYALYSTSTGALQGRSVANTNPATNQVLKWNGSTWSPADDAIGAPGSGDISAVYAGSGLTGGGTTGEVTLTVAFAGSGISTSVARTDHAHSGVYSLVGHTHPGSDISSAVPTATLAISATNSDMLDGLHGAAYQQRVSGTCASGNAIRVVNADGSVSCEPLTGSGWSLTGNAGTNPLTNFLGTADNVSLTLRVNNVPALRLIPNATSPNLVGGHSGNSLLSGLSGAVIAGGGSVTDPNRVTANFGTIGGGYGNVVSGTNATVGGGYVNAASNNASTISGGVGNQATGAYSFVGGGSYNTASNSYATVSGGYDNRITATFGTIAGGYNITVTGEVAAVGGGQDNVASARYATIGGGYLNRVSGYEGTVAGGADNHADYRAAVGGGLSNSALGAYAAVSGGYENTASGEYATVGGGHGNLVTATHGTIAGGYIITVTGEYAAVGGGEANVAGGDLATIGGGQHNSASVRSATVGGGVQNNASGFAATIGGGGVNSASGSWATVSGGNYSTASGFQATVGGGAGNVASGYDAVIGGGWGNTASGSFATIAGGNENYSGNTFATIGGGEYIKAFGQAATVAGGSHITVTGGYAAVGGGQDNAASAQYATIGGGYLNGVNGYEGTVAGGADNRADYRSAVGGGLSNSAVGAYSAIGGGESNLITATHGVIAGGYNITVTGEYAAVGGGRDNAANAQYATIGGGYLNGVSGYEGTVAGGADNHAHYRGTVGGGLSNSAVGAYATIPGGLYNHAGSDYSFAAGRRATANHIGAFVWADSTDAFFFSSNPNQFNARATGGVRLVVGVDGSGNPTWTCSVVNGGSWACSSDKGLKENLQPVTPQAVLDKLAQMPVYYWNAKGVDARHIGPTAQDFAAAFAVGEDKTAIATIDLDGVALGAIQGLYQIVQEKDVRITAQQQEIDALKQQSTNMAARLSALEARVSDESPSNVFNGWSALGLGLAGLMVGFLVIRRGGAR